MINIKGMLGLVVALAASCGEPTGSPGGGEDAAGGGGGMAGAAGGEGGSGGMGGSWDGSPQLGFGFDGAPCDAQHAFVERARSGDMPMLTSTPIAIPVDGWIVRATVVHAAAASGGGCDVTGRSVLISEPVKEPVPDGPAVHEAIAWSAEEVTAAPQYPLPGTAVSETKELGRDLVEPLHVVAGQYVHLGSLIDAEPICVVASGALLDGSAPPEGHAYCAAGATWSACGTMPYPGSPDHVAYIAWVDFVAE